MGSDRARRTVDTGQQYRRVVMQQGRVFVEADWNEQGEIWDEDARRTLLDLIGPGGTPDNGYEVCFPDPQHDYEFTVGPGTMYVGGARLALAEAMPYNHQPDWLHAPAPATAPGRELISLEVHEQEISAVEDEALLEVALGGPDTAQRVRLVQQIVRISTEAHDCREARQAAKVAWQERGLALDEKTSHLQSQAALRVSFQAADGEDGSGSYLGADNQLIRVQISADRKLLWGYDNASFLYQVDVGKDRLTLTLHSQPVDEFHQPRPGQAVEALRSAVRLHNGAHLASLTGHVAVVAAPYDPSAQTVTLAEPLPAGFHHETEQSPIYLRVWEEELEFAPNVPLPLGDTGLQVTLRGTVFGVGDYWTVAVRANTPQTVYPSRYLEAFQPPEGPRRWSIPLAVIGWNRAKEGKILDDCRHRFSGLGMRQNAGGCCTLTLCPEDITDDNSLQAVLDGYRNQDQITVCLMPGTYALPNPLTLGPEHSNLTLEGCHDGAVLQVADGAEANFIDGLIVLCNADNVTLRNLRFELPQVPFVDSGGRLAKVDPEAMFTNGGPQIKDLRVSIGIRPWQCANLTIRDCLFRYSVSPALDLLAAGIFGGGNCSGLVVKGNRFLRETGSLGEAPLRLLIGFLLSPTVTFKSVRGASFTSASVPAGTLSRSLLQNASFEDNTFTGLTVAVLILSDFGLTRLTGNTVRDSHAGLWLLSSHSLAFIKSFDRLDANNGNNGLNLARTMRLIDADPIIQVGTVLARGYPPPLACDVVAEDVEGTTGPAVARAVGAVVTEVRHVESFLERLRGAMLHHETPGVAAPEAAAVTPTPTPDPAYLASRWSGYDALGQRFSALIAGVAAASAKTGARLSLHCADNEIDTIVDKGESSLGLLIWEDSGARGSAQSRSAPSGAGSEIIVSANKLRSQSPALPTAFLLLVDRCAVTGNVIVNEAVTERETAAGSLDLVPGPAENQIPPVVVTGNLFRGQAHLPNRPGSQLPPWDYLNTQIS